MNKYRIENPNNNKVRDCKSRTTKYFKDKKAFRCSLIGEQITACNMPYFEITSINKL